MMVKFPTRQEATVLMALINQPIALTGRRIAQRAGMVGQNIYNLLPRLHRAGFLLHFPAHTPGLDNAVSTWSLTQAGANAAAIIASWKTHVVVLRETTT